MTSAQTQARFKASLDLIHQYMTNLGFEAFLAEPNEDLPISILGVELEKDEQERPRTLIFSFIPEEELENIDLLQLYTVLPISVKEEVGADLGMFLVHVNNLCPIGHFGINTENEIYFRYTLCVKQNEPIAQSIIEETGMLYNYALDSYANIVEEVYTGVVSYEEAMLALLTVNTTTDTE